MRKFGLVALACISITLIATACGSEVKTNSPDVKETTASVDNGKQEEETKMENETKESETEKTEASTIEDVLKDTPWKLVLENTFEYKCYDALCFNESTALSVGYRGEIHYFQNSDSTWPQAENESLCRFGLDIIDGTVCYTCGNGGNVTKSVDGGKTFVKKTDIVSSEACSMISFIDENTGIAASKMDFVITKDGAETWTTLKLPATAEIICIKMETADRFCYIDSSLTLYRTEDGGSSWEAISLNLPEGDDYVSIRKNIDITAEGDNTYTIYCVQKSSLMIKSYTTKDNFATYIENTMPELKVGICYLHVKGNYLSLYNATNKSVTVLAKSEN